MTVIISGQSNITPYATADDLGAYLGTEPPADSDRLLIRAQELIDATLTSAMYTSDSNGNPTDATVIGALRQATCAQVEYWITNGDELGTLDKYSSYSIEGISVSRGNVGSSRQYRLCDRSWDVLRAAKLAPGTVFST